MEIKIKIPNVEYNLLQMTGREINLLVNALLGRFSNLDKETSEYEELKEIIDKIEEAVSRVDKF